MSAPEPHQRIPVSASLIIQVLVAFACLLGAIVLPSWYAEFQGPTQILLYAVGGIAAAVAVVNVVFGRRLSQTMARMGMRSRVVIPREGLVYLGIMLLLAIGGLVGHSNMLLLVFGLMAGPWILNGWFVYMALRAVSVERRPRDRVMAGQSLTVDITVSNGKHLMASQMLDVRDEISAANGRDRQLMGAGIVTIARIPAGQNRTGHYKLIFPRRGRYRLGPLRVSSRFPLGIGERGQVFPDFCNILIRPRLVRLRDDWLRRLHAQAESNHRESARRGVFEDEFHRIREFRDGDSPRSVHWRSTARRGQLMVQELHQNRESSLFVLLDLSSDTLPSQDDIELAVSVAATLCAGRASGGAVGYSMLAVTGSVPAFVCDIKAGRFVDTALDALAVCGPAKSPPLDVALRDLADAGGLLNGQGVLLTTRPEYCHLAVADLCAELVPDAFDIAKHLTIVPVTAAGLHEVAVPETSVPAPRHAAARAPR